MSKSRDTAVGERLLDHVANGTTDVADDIRRIPVSYYLDPDLWEQEMRNIWKRLPLMLGFSSEVAEPGAYRALDVVGIPVLILRGSDGVVRAFLNACRHRASRLVDEGQGQCRRLICPYHAWAYDDKGSLVGIFKSKQFGEIERETLGLRELPCEEIAGLIFVSLTPDEPTNVRQYLSGMAEELETLGIEEWQVYDRRELYSANWKATFDGYVDGYHLEVLHPKTVGLLSKGAVNTFQSFGPHQKIGFANQNIEEIRQIPSSEWAQDQGFGFVRTLFPSTSLAVTAGYGGLISQLIPGPTPDRSKTIQSFVYAQLPETEQERKQTDQMIEMFHSAVRDEDYRTVEGVQQAMASGAMEEVVLGRNEVGNQWMHDWVTYYGQDDPRPEDRPDHG